MPTVGAGDDGIAGFTGAAGGGGAAGNMDDGRPPRITAERLVCPGRIEVGSSAITQLL